MIPSIALSAKKIRWPKIQAIEGKRVFKNLDKGTPDTPFVALIYDTRGDPIYKLECHNVNYEYESGIDYSGDFQCALFAVKGNTLISGDLLATKSAPNSAWWNRGRMLSVQLRGECLKYPEYSTDRHFQLRGMLITLRFRAIHWSKLTDQQNNPMLEGFTFNLSVVPDPSAKSSKAEGVKGPKPPAACYP